MFRTQVPNAGTAPLALRSSADARSINLIGIAARDRSSSGVLRSLWPLGLLGEELSIYEGPNGEGINRRKLTRYRRTWLNNSRLCQTRNFSYRAAQRLEQQWLTLASLLLDRSFGPQSHWRCCQPAIRAQGARPRRSRGSIGPLGLAPIALPGCVVGPTFWRLYAAGF